MATGGLLRWDWHRAAPGHAFYLPDLYYFYDAEDHLPRPKKDFPVAKAAQVTACCLARWSDTFRATPSFHREPLREGPLPETPEEREAFVEALFGWFAEAHPQGFAAEMSLRAGERWVMDAHDGFPGPLHLTPEQFALLQDRLQAAELPRDLYYPILNQREAIEPAEWYGGVVRQLRFYSPQQWAHRDVGALAAMVIPSEEARRDAFVEDCRRFLDALHRRQFELREPGQDLRSDELLELEELWSTVHQTWQRASGRDERARRWSKAEPQAGWSTTPTAFQALQTSLPALRRLHDAGYVWQLISEGARVDRPIARWSVSMWAPNGEQSFSYRMVNGVLFGPGIELRIDARDTPPIWPFEQEGPPELLDSDAALRHAEAAGGRAFRERMGAGLGELRLHGRDDGSPVWVASYGRWYPHVGLRIWLDARTGAVVATREDPQPPPAAE